VIGPAPSRPPIRLSLAVVVILALGSPTGRAEVVPARTAGDARIRTAEYDANEVYRIRGFVGFQIDLEFEPGESFIGLASGDIEALSFVAQDNHLFLKPRVAAVGTNLTILTTRRHYHVLYTASVRRPQNADPELIYAVRFHYPVPPQTKLSSVVDERLETAPQGRVQNLDYWYCGAPALRPVAASDDGVHTRLRFGSQAELPAIFVRNEDRSESLLNFTVEAGDIVVHRIAHQFVLRRGALTGCVVNKHFVGQGIRLESGTVAPNVQRQRRETSP
jgi:type IV secretion system protein VirB9